jgi:L-iditol 2-dehydrogenase
MKAAFLQEIEKLIVKDVPDPTADKGGVVLRIKSCAICNSDLRLFHYGHKRTTLPQILGHELCGVIEQINGQIDGFKIGDRVQTTPKISCGSCYYCQRGNYLACPKGASFGYQLPGGFAEYMAVPKQGVDFGVMNVVYDSLSDNEAAMAEPLACCLRAQQMTPVKQGDVVVIIGGGPIGILHCRVAKSIGAKVILIEHDQKRLNNVDLSSIDVNIEAPDSELPPQIMELTENEGADVAIVACSSTRAQVQALHLVNNGGRINYFGGLGPVHREISIDSDIIHYGELTITGTHGSLPQNNKLALDLIAAGIVKVDDLVSHTFNLSEITEAFTFAQSKQGMHVAVVP